MSQVPVGLFDTGSKYVIRGTLADGTPVCDEEPRYTKAKQVAAKMALWTGNPVVVERYKLVGGAWVSQGEVQ